MMENNDYICYIGRPSFQKNTFFLIDVVKGVHEKYPELKFKLLGVGYYSPDLKQLKDMIHEQNLEEVIELLPWLNHEETLSYVQRALFYLTVSRYEGLPLAVIEAMSLGKAIIASDVLGNKDCVVNNENGFLLPLDCDAFVKSIIKLATDKELRAEMGQASRNIFENRFLIDKQIKKLQQIYNS